MDSNVLSRPCENCICLWWEKHGQYAYPTSERLLILADGGGSNSARSRMFNAITQNWAGKPLVSFDALVNFARKTSTKTGLRIEAYRDQRIYEKGNKVSDGKTHGLA